MIERFTGPAGQRPMLHAMKENTAVRHNEALATRLIAAGELKTYGPNTPLIEQGAADNDVCFVLMGEVEILVNGVRVAKRGAGDHVGEMAAIDPLVRRSASVRTSQETVVLRVPEASISSIANDFPILWRNFALELGNRIRQRAEYCVSPNEKPKMFIGCSVEGLNVAKAIQENLHHLRLEVVIWTQGVFGPSEATVDSLLHQVKSADFAMFVLTQDDVTQSRGQERAAPRDNVVFELGLFMGTLGRERTLMVRPRGADIKIPTDLLGLTMLDYQVSDGSDALLAALGPACNKIERITKKLGSKQH